MIAFLMIRGGAQTEKQKTKNFYLTVKLFYHNNNNKRSHCNHAKVFAMTKKPCHYPDPKGTKKSKKN